MYSTVIMIDGAAFTVIAESLSSLNQQIRELRERNA